MAETSSVASVEIAASHMKESPVGLCYGRLSSHLPTADQVLRLYHDHHISKMWIRDTGDEGVIDLLEALYKDTDTNKLEVVLCISNSQLKTLVDNDSAAGDWVEKHITNYKSINFSYICVGDLGSMTTAESNLIVQAMKNIINAIGSKPVKVSTIVDVSTNLDAYDVWKDPSTCKFADVDLIKKVLYLLNSTSPETPLFARIIPYFEITDDVDLSHYLFTATWEYMFKYKYVYDAMVDSIFCAMDHAGYVNVPLVALTGWPTSGSKDATLSNAQEYNKHVAGHVNCKTPKNNQCMKTFIHSLIDEDKIDRGEEEWKHFGSFVLWKTETFPSA